MIQFILGVFSGILILSFIIWYFYGRTIINETKDLINEYKDIKYTDNSAFVINLKERPERWEQIQKDFKDTIPLIRIDGIKHKMGHLGCGASFMKVIRLAKLLNLKTILIFEDDNKPFEGFYEKWKIIKNYLDNNLDKWEIFNGGSRMITYAEEIKDLSNNIQLIKTSGTNTNNWVYINSSVYDKILEYEKNNNNLIDFYFSLNFNFFCCYPRLATQHDYFSDTENFQRNYTNEENTLEDTYKKVILTYKINNNNVSTNSSQQHRLKIH